MLDIPFIAIVLGLGLRFNRAMLNGDGDPACTIRQAAAALTNRHVGSVMVFWVTRCVSALSRASTTERARRDPLLELSHAARWRPLQDLIRGQAHGGLLTGYYRGVSILAQVVAAQALSSDGHPSTRAIYTLAAMTGTGGVRWSSHFDPPSLSWIISCQSNAKHDELAQVLDSADSPTIGGEAELRYDPEHGVLVYAEAVASYDWTPGVRDAVAQLELLLRLEAVSCQDRGSVR